MTRIMLVDDEKSLTDALKRRLKKHRKDWAVDTFYDPLEALRAQKNQTYQVIISDYQMSAIDGVVLLKESKIYQRDAVRIVLSGQSQLDNVIRAINEAEIYRYLEKPVNIEDLISTIDQALYFRKVLVENEELANLVRRQKNELARAKRLIDEYEVQYPGAIETIAILKDDEEF